MYSMARGKRITKDMLSFYKPTKEEENIIAKGIFMFAPQSYHRLFTKPLGKGKTQVYCSHCQTYEVIDNKKLKEVRASHICPFCFSKIKRCSNKSEIEIFDWVQFEGIYGFETCVKWEFGKQPKVYSMKQVMYFPRPEEKYTYCSGYYAHEKCKGFIKQVGVSFMGQRLTYVCDKPWEVSMNYDYINQCYSFNSLAKEIDFKKITYKEYLSKLTKDIPLVKSNQKEIMMNNLVDRTQVALIVGFDLKNIEETYKYSKDKGLDYVLGKSHYYGYSYRNDGLIDQIATEKPLNKYYLEYLIKNEISVNDFYDYRKDMEKLGYKLDKPKNFAIKHQEIAQQVATLYKKNVNKYIKEHADKLPSYQKDNIKISPFKTSKEIRDCAKKLHNCIATYIEKYAKEDTRLFHLDVDNKLVVAIEVGTNGSLIQAKANQNDDCPKDLFKNVLEFCKQNNYKTRSKDSSNY